jgi:hypothetical protein
MKRSERLRGWYTIDELVAAFPFASPGACRHWLRTWHVPTYRRGRLVDGQEIELVAQYIESLVQQGQAYVDAAGRLFVLREESRSAWRVWSGGSR